MSRANRLIRGAGAAALGLAAIWSMTSKHVAAQTEPPTPNPADSSCVYDRRVDDYRDANGNECRVCLYDATTGGFRDQHGRECRTALGYRWGTYFGYVSARSAVLRKVGDHRYPVWAEYADDRFITEEREDIYGKRIEVQVHLPGAPQEIAVATEAYENAKVLVADEVAFAAQAFSQLKKSHTKPDTEPAPRERYEIVTKTYYESSSTKFFDQNDNAVEPKPRLDVNTTHVMVLKKEYVPPQGPFVIREFPLDPRQAEEALAGNVPRVEGRPTVPAGDLKSFLVATRTQDIGKILVAGNGVITYLAGFGEAMTDAEAKINGVRGGICADSAARKVEIDGKEYTAWDDLHQFEGCDSWSLRSVWGGMIGARVDTGSRWMMDRFLPVTTRYQLAGKWTNEDGTEEPRELVGRFDLQYPYPAGTQFWDTLFVSMAFAPFDPRVPFGSRFITRRRVQGGATLETNPGFISALGASFSGSGFGNGLNGYSSGGNPFTLATEGALIDTQKPRSVNVAIELAYMTGQVVLANLQRFPHVPMPDQRVISIDGTADEPPAAPPSDVSDADASYFEAKTSYGHIHDRQPNRTDVRIDLRTGLEIDASSGASSSDSGDGGEGGAIPFIRRYQVSQEPGAASNQGGAGPVDVDATIAGQLSPDGTPSPIYDSDLVHDITRKDFANTDVHVFGPSGDLITSRIGLRQNETPGMDCDRPAQQLVILGASPRCIIVDHFPPATVHIQDFIHNRYPGSRYKVAFVNRSTGYIGTGFVRVGGPRAFTGALRDHLGVGGATGNDGGAANDSGGGTSDNDLFARLGPKDFVSAYQIESSDGKPIIFMRPPNLTIRVTRTRQDVKTIVGDDTPVQQLVGFEGGGLVDDTQVVISTEWFDHDGSPLPDSLPGYTGRLTRVIDEEGTLGHVEGAATSEQGAGAVGHFPIRPGRNITVVKLPDNVPAHYYVHVSGANADRCGGEELQLANPDTPDGFRWFQSHSPACTSFAQEIDEEFEKQKDRRPDRYVPVLVPIFDAAATRDASQLQITLARDRAQAKLAAGEKLTAEDLLLPKTPAIYTDVYRAEAQFTLYELSEFEAPELVTRFDKDKERGRTTLSFGYELGDSGFDPLAPYGSSKDEIWGLGFEELVAMVNDDNAKVEFDDLERILLLSPAQQLQEVQDVVDGLTPEDYLALQLYLGNDRGNALYVDKDVAFPLLDIDATPLTLYRRETLARFPSDVEPPPPISEGFEAIPFGISRESYVTISATPRGLRPNDAKAITLVARNKLSAGKHYFVLDGEQLSEKKVPNKFTLHFQAELVPDDAQSDAGPFKTHRVEIKVTRETVRDRGLGEIVEHGVNIVDGSLRLSREDFSLPSKGPALALTRGYSNLASDSDGLLGPGWSHSFDLRLTPTTIGLAGAGAVPEWVKQLREKTSPCLPNNCPIETEQLYPNGGVQITGLMVNGTSFRREGQEWVPELTRHVKLEQRCLPNDPDEEKLKDCFEYTSKDGTRYVYPYPKTKAPPDPSAGPAEHTMFSMQDTLLPRVDWFELHIDGNIPEPAAAAEWRRSTLVRKITDRFGYSLEFTEDKGRIAQVREGEGGANRSCSFHYEPDQYAACPENPPAEKKRLYYVECLKNESSDISGPLNIRVSYCYDAAGNLASVKRGEREEQYQYEPEPEPAGQEGEDAEGDEEDRKLFNLHAAIEVNADGNRTTTYTYRSGTGKFKPGVAPGKPGDGFDEFDMVDTITYPPTTVDGDLNDTATATIQFGYVDRQRTVSDARGAGHFGRRYLLNPYGNPLKLEEADNKVTTMAWSFDGASSSCGVSATKDNQMVSRTVTQGGPTAVTISSSFVYDEDGNVTRECIESADGQLVSITGYGPFGTVASHTDFRGVTEQWIRDENDGFLTEYINGANVRRTYTRSSEFKGRAGSETVHGDASRTTQFSYDATGGISKVQIVGAPLPVKRAQFDLRGRTELEWDALGEETKLVYDTNDNLRFVYLPNVPREAQQHLVTTLEYDYDASGNRTKENDRNGVEYEYQYTLRNQVKTVTRIASGAVVPRHSRELRYDALGNVRSETDWKGAKTKYEYDALGHLRTKTDREGFPTVTERDHLGNVYRFVDPAGLAVDISYDVLNRERTKKPDCDESEEPECALTTTSYPRSPAGVSAPGLVYTIEVVQAQAKTISGFDGADHLLIKKGPGSGLYTALYDSLGRVKQTTDEEGVVTTQTYDVAGFPFEKRRLGRGGGSDGLLTTYTADNAGRVLFEKIKNGSGDLVTAMTYDAWGRVSTRQAPGSPVEHLHYDGSGQLVREVDAGGRTRDWVRNKRGELIEVVNAESASRTPGQPSSPKSYTLHYDRIDANGNPELVTNANGVQTEIKYDDEERVIEVIEAKGTEDQRSREMLEIDGAGNPRQIKDYRGNVQTFTYTKHHRVKTITDELSRVVAYTYSRHGKVSSLKNPRGYTRQLVRDVLGRVEDVFYPCASVPCSAQTLEAHHAYDNVGNVLETRNRRGAVTHFEYDKYLRLEHVRRSLGSGELTRLETREYDDASNVTATIDAHGARTEYRYNGRNLLEKTILPADEVEPEPEASRTESRDYYPSGTLKTLTLPTSPSEQARIVTYEYDKEDRRISDSAGGEKTSYGYDILGNRRFVTRPESQAGGKYNKSKELEYDALNRLVLVRDEVGLATKYTYDAADHLTDVEGPFLGNAPGDVPHVGYRYDEQSDRLAEHIQYHEGGRVSTRYEEYDEHDNVKKIIDANGRIFQYGYDEHDRRTSATYPNAPTAYYEPTSTSWDYDDDANTRTITEHKTGPGAVVGVEVTIERFEAKFDRLQSRTTRGSTVTYGYDDRGNVTRVDSPAGVTDRTFDVMNRVRTVSFGTDTTTYHYYADGRVRSVDRGNDTTTTYAYWPQTRRVMEIRHQFAAGESTVVGYTYDRNGNVTSRGDTRSGAPDVTSFTEYDAADRLVSFERGGDTTTYGYDRYNRTSEKVERGGVALVQKKLAYDDLERLETITDELPGGAVVSYGYDNNGNTLSRDVSNAPADKTDFEYNSRDQLVRVTRGPPANKTVLGRYDYDSNGLRIRSANDERGAVDYLHDGGAVLEERIEAGVAGAARSTRYHYGEDLVAVAEAAGTRYFHQDGLGTALNLTDGAGLSVVGYKHDPWGQVRSSDGEDTDNRHTYTAQEFDEKTGLYYYNARYYEPAAGRFLTQDTYLGNTGTPGTLNRYRYAASNPARYIDPSGHGEWDALENNLEKAYDWLDKGVDDLGNTSNVICGASGGGFLNFVCQKAVDEQEKSSMLVYTAAKIVVGTAHAGAKAVDYVATGLYAATGAVYDSDLADRSWQDFRDETQIIAHSASALSEGETWKKIGANVANTLVDAAMGDLGAQSDVIENIAGFVDPAVAARNVGRTLLNVARSLPRGIQLVRTGVTATRLTLESGAARAIVTQAPKLLWASAGRFTRAAARTTSDAAIGLRAMGPKGALSSFKAGFKRAMSATARPGVHVSYSGIPPEAIDSAVKGAASLLADAKGVGKALREGAEGAASQSRGLRYVLEGGNQRVSPRTSAAQIFEDSLEGAYSDVASGRRVVPALGFDPPASVAGGSRNPFIRFDGVEAADASVLIDRKLSLVRFPTRNGPMIPQASRIRETLLALDQNPGFRVIYEFPNAAAARSGRSILRELGIADPRLTTRVAP